MSPGPQAPGAARDGPGTSSPMPTQSPSRAGCRWPMCTSAFTETSPTARRARWRRTQGVPAPIVRRARPVPAGPFPLALAPGRALWSIGGVTSIWLPGATEPPTLEGRRIRLRAIRDDDADGLFVVFSDPEAMRFWSASPVADIEQIRERIRLVRDWFTAREGLQWAIALHDDDRCVGTATLFNISPPNRRAEFGCSLARMLWGQGIAREAVGMMLRFGFDHLGLERIEADIDPRNANSIRLVERMGFQREGVLRARWRVGGQVQDSALYGLLREDFRP